MNISLSNTNIKSNQSIKISGSKSETNRLLILQAQFPHISLQNISDSDDTNVLTDALSSTDQIIDIHHSGTAMRFLTAYFATQARYAVTLTGSKRMKQRPIKILVDALRQLGADIEYLEDDGFPPLKIVGKNKFKDTVTLNANVSSQYISALLLIAPKLQNGLEIILEGGITSRPYIQMTLDLLHEVGIKSVYTYNTIYVNPTPNAKQPTSFTIESDWSSASYFYSIIALANPGATITLSTFKNDSYQGDSALSEIYKIFGVQTEFKNGTIILTKRNTYPKVINLDLNNNPDLAQTIAVTCVGLGVECHLSGLHTLQIKETDRLQALHDELTKLGANVSITYETLHLKPSGTIIPNIKIATYDDHRMAMAFAPLAIKAPITIENAEVVSKSYPSFWNDLQTIGFNINLIE